MTLWIEQTEGALAAMGAAMRSYQERTLLAQLYNTPFDFSNTG